MLIQSSIRAIVSHRSKREDRLAKKVNERKRRKRYKKVEDIFEDISDLAGVRIALYFPDDKSEVERLINSSFVVEKAKVDKWIEFEAKLRSIAESKLGNYTGPLSPSLLKKLEVFSDVNDLQIVDTLRRLRNQIVHGTGAPKSDIVEAEKEISRLLNSLEGQYSIAPRRRPRDSSVVLERGLKD